MTKSGAESRSAAFALAAVTMDLGGSSGGPPLSNLYYYQCLGLRRTDSTQDEVKRAYKRLSLKYHPDRNRDDPTTTAKFQEIATAYTVLSSARKRQVYDAYGEQGLKMYDSYMSFADSDDDGSKMPLQPVTMLLMVRAYVAASTWHARECAYVRARAAWQ